MEKLNYKKAGWIHNTNIYEVNLRQYTIEGSFNAFAKELPRLRDMGVETLWFMPVTPISKKNRKGTMGSYYACSDYTSTEPEFGTIEDFKNLINLAHSMGFKVILDWVANHTGWDHVWTTTHPGYFLKDDATGDFKIASGMDDIIELDYKNPALRKAMIDAMAFWVNEFDIDGFRADLAFWVELNFWKEARTALESIKTLFWLAEADPLDNPEYLEVFDAAYTWTWMHKTAAFYKGEATITVLRNVIDRYDAVCGNNAIPLWFTSNHDENSWNGTEYEKYGDMAKLLAVFSFTYNGMPMIYSGQESPNLKRLEFFEKDIIEWNGIYELHTFYHTLLELHTNNPALRAADASVITYPIDTGENNNVIAFLRKNGNSEVLVLLNFSNEGIIFELNNQELEGKYNNVFNKEITSVMTGKEFELKPWGYLVYEK
ncbi:MAG: alpha-amylase family glycosyl hydrolase [Ferruginibacter sp.]